MDFRDFPFDKQLCPIKMEPYANRKKQLNLSWHVMGTAAEKAQYKGSIQDSVEDRLRMIYFIFIEYIYSGGPFLQLKMSEILQKRPVLKTGLWWKKGSSTVVI